jgi:predicted PurR-regulated permease PerM
VSDGDDRGVNAESIRRFRVAPLLTATVLTVLLLWLFKTVADVFILLFLGILIALYLGALTSAIQRRLRIPERMAYAASIVLTLAGVAGLLWVLVPPVIEQTQQLVGVLPTYVAAWEAGIERVLSRFPAMRDVLGPGENRILRVVYEEVANQFRTVGTKVVGIVHGAINVFAIGVMGIYLSLHPALYREWLIALFPPLHRELVRDVIGDLGDTLRSWIVGQLLAMAVLAVFTAIGLYVLGVPYWLTFGVFTGLVAIVPFFGTLVSTVLPALFVLNTAGGGQRAILVILLGTVIHLFEANVVAPLVMSRKVDLPPVLTIMSVLVIGKLLGPIGLIVAVPTLAVLMVVVRRILLTRIYEGQGFRRSTRERALVLRLPAPGGGVLSPPGPPPDVLAMVERLALRRSA